MSLWEISKGGLLVCGMGVAMPMSLQAEENQTVEVVEEVAAKLRWKLKQSTLILTPGPQNTSPFKRFCYYSISRKEDPTRLTQTRSYHFAGSMMFYEFGEKDFAKKLEGFSGTSLFASPDEKTIFLDEDISNASGPNHTYILIQMKPLYKGGEDQYTHSYLSLPASVEAYEASAYDKEGKLIPDLHDTSPTITKVTNETLHVLRRDGKKLTLKLSEIKKVKGPVVE